MPKFQKLPPEKKPSANRQVINYVVKRSLKLYDLVEVTIEDDVVTERKVLASDMPLIIMGKMVRLMREQKVSDAV